MPAELQIALKALVSIVVLFLFTRAMGKRAISQLNFFDYVTGISIGAVAGAFILARDVTIWQGIIALAVLALFPILLSWIALKSFRGRKLLDGVPTILIQNGKIIEHNLRKSKINLNDLAEKCRVKGAFDLADVEFAILETGGDVSLLKKAPAQPVTPRDLQLGTPAKGLPTNLILDGRILRDNLMSMDHDEAWLMEELKKQSVSDPGEVLLGWLDAQSVFHVDLKDRDPRPRMLM